VAATAVTVVVVGTEVEGVADTVVVARGVARGAGFL